MPNEKKKFSDFFIVVIVVDVVVFHTDTSYLVDKRGVAGLLATVDVPHDGSLCRRLIPRVQHFLIGRQQSHLTLVSEIGKSKRIKHCCFEIACVSLTASLW
jgi:hypothetical protein